MIDKYHNLWVAKMKRDSDDLFWGQNLGQTYFRTKWDTRTCGVRHCTLNFPLFSDIHQKEKSVDNTVIIHSTAKCVFNKEGFITSPCHWCSSHPLTHNEQDLITILHTDLSKTKKTKNMETYGLCVVCLHCLHTWKPNKTKKKENLPAKDPWSSQQSERADQAHAVFHQVKTAQSPRTGWCILTSGHLLPSNKSESITSVCMPVCASNCQVLRQSCQ